LPNTSICSLGNTLAPSDACENIPGDWSSGFYDPVRKRIVVTGVGHNTGATTQGCDNAFYAVQLDANPPHPMALNLRSSGQASHGLYADGTPQWGHTYDVVVYAANADAFVEAGSWGACPDAGSNGGKFWSLPMTNLPPVGNLTAIPSSAYSTSASNLSVQGGADYDPVSGLIFAVSSGIAPLNLQSYNPITGSVATVNTHAWCYPGTNIVDPDLRCMYCLSHAGGSNPTSSQTMYFDINPGRKTYGKAFGVSPSGCPIWTDWPGADWDPIAHYFVVWNFAGSPSGNQLYAYNPDSVPHGGVAANSCAPLNPPGSGPPSRLDGTNNGTFKRFRYANYCDCFVVINDGLQDAYIVRTR